MGIMTATEFAKNLKRALDRVEFGGEEIIIVRNNHKIARLIPGPPHMTAIEAMADLYRTLPPDAAEDWLKDQVTITEQQATKMSNILIIDDDKITPHLKSTR